MRSMIGLMLFAGVGFSVYKDEERIEEENRGLRRKRQTGPAGKVWGKKNKKKGPFEE